jgi:glucosamine-6-phosphate deaminase
MCVPSRSFQFAGMAIQVWPSAEIACKVAAERIIRVIHGEVASRGRAILGLATGSTPEPVYAHLVQKYRENAVSFLNVTTYNLDEYYPISPLDPRSYHTYMHRHLFSKVDLVPNRAHLLDGTVPQAFTAAHAAEFDGWIEDDGGLDLQLLGIGRNGHIGFNEPSGLAVAEALRLPTRLVELHPITRADAARHFGGEERVIPQALTMGLQPILAARAILMLATGARKAEVIAAALRGPMTAGLPASLLQSVAAKVTWILDEPAAGSLGGVRGPLDSSGPV